MTKTRLLILLAVLVLSYVVLLGVNAMSKPGSKLGVTNGRLADCPDKPNCVLSQAIDGQHAIDPFKFTGESSTAWAALRSVVENYPRVTIIVEQDGYLRCEFRSAIMRFVDDVEFLLNADNSTIEFRSASRLGYSDMGANRKRMEKICGLFAKALESSEKN